MMKKILALVLSVVMMLSFAACGGNDANVVETDLSKPVTLNWIMPGPGIQKDAEMVWAKFNEELKKIEGFENVTVNIEVIPMADYAQKIMLMQTSGEKMDLIQTYQLNYAQEFRNGTIMDMGPYLKKYAKESLEELPQWVVDMGKVDGAQAPDGVTYQIIRSTTDEVTPSEFSVSGGDGITIIVTKQSLDTDVKVMWNPGNETGTYQTEWMPSYDHITGKTSYSAVYNVDNISADTVVTIY